jgi:hypothetical protein
MTRWIFLDNQNEHTFYLSHDMDIAMTIWGQNHPMMMTLLREIFHKDESNVGQTPFQNLVNLVLHLLQKKHSPERAVSNQSNIWITSWAMRTWCYRGTVDSKDIPCREIYMFRRRRRQVSVDRLRCIPLSCSFVRSRYEYNLYIQMEQFEVYLQTRFHQSMPPSWLLHVQYL